MEDLNRRSALALGLSVGGASVLAFATPAAAAMYAADAGKEILPGVRQVDIGKGAINIGTYKTAVVADFVFAPGSVMPNEAMKNDSICQILEGELWIKQGDQEFTAKAGDVFACAKGTFEENRNKSSAVAIMRGMDLLPA